MNFLKEWNASCVDDRITFLNVTPLDGSRPYEYLFYSEALPRRNDGRLRAPLLKQYQHLEQGGWWCSGIDVLTGEEDIWGCFKPIQPRRARVSRKGGLPAIGKQIKYEHPPKAATGVFALRVPIAIWQAIAARYEQPIRPEDIDRARPDLGFWQWLKQHPTIPICITEGAKKAGALLTAGYAAIAIPGIDSGYRVPRNERNERIGKPYLIPQLHILAQSQRPFYLVFDRDSKPNTIKAVNTSLQKMGHLLEQQGCSVNIVTWNSEDGKGVDDFIAACGTQAFERAYNNALTLATWRAQTFTQLTYPPDLRLNYRYLLSEEIQNFKLKITNREADLPSTFDLHNKVKEVSCEEETLPQLIGIKSPKGTGKTQWLEGIVKDAISRGQWVLVIGHRVQLVRELCDRFGIDYIANARPSLARGYGLCIDSLHPNSQAQFEARDWQDGIVIIDEVEQVLWHALNSSTCQNNRVAILKSLKTLMQNVLGGKGRVYVADADLSDVSLDYLLSLAGVQQKPFIIQNDWKPEPQDAWQVYHYADSTPDRLVGDLVQHIQQGGKPFVCLSAQKLTSQWGTRALEGYLKERFPDVRILRIDSESVAASKLRQLNEILPDYDIVLASPSIETGVSLDLRGHFTSVWAIAQGIQGETSVRQSLSRLRENLPRYLWVAPYGFNQVGNGSTSIPSLLSSGQRLTQLNVRLLQQSDFEGIDDLEVGFQAESLLCWARFAVRLNASMLNYRESVLGALRGEGHQVCEVSPEVELREETPEVSLSSAINAVREQNYQAECIAIARSPDLNEEDYRTAKKRMVKNLTERRSQRKAELQQRYGVPVTAALVAKDDRGWYEQIRLHYFLTLGRSHLADRDAAVAKHLLEQGEGDIFLPDFNRSQLGAIVGTMERLGIPLFLQERGREFRNSDPDLQEMAAIALQNRAAIKAIASLGLAKNSSPVTVLRRFLELLGCGLKYLRIESQGKKRLRVYGLEIPNDGRLQVFHVWLRRDRSFEVNFDNFPALKPRPDSNDSRYVQLNLLDL
ncbi:plasmid replication protein, CyRepA1 family [Oscillatoria sp. FACHB-1406]|uniref:plasmid replication protein, CyRepA1 family n=1 Tax=Oscillatoria sp. FACHB-1406 TaxID=2692846 RepID=UPI0016884AF1|nr:DUF3854 domain-containing protein [Oscillatoria sp. FACHB-1406]